MPRIVNVSISAVLMALALAASVPAATHRASITVHASMGGVSVTGRNFLPRERVVLKATINAQPLRRTVRADTAGQFTTRLDTDDATCSAVSVTATGGRGSTATTRRIRIPDACGIVVQP